MRRGISLLLTLAACFLTAHAPARAQSLGSPTVDFNLDMRLKGGGPASSGAKIYNRTVRIAAPLAPGLSAHIFGADKYGASKLQEAGLVKTWGAQQVEGGIVRLPFGVYDYRETYASGIIDYPLPRNDYLNHSVDWGVPGASFSGGVPKLRVEAAAFGGKGAGVWSNSASLGGAAVRLQTYTENGFVLGASRWDGYQQSGYAGGPNRAVDLSGFDMRYTQGHWLLRGEYLAGNYAGDWMHGGYLDAYYRLPQFQKWTLASRIEELRPGADYGTRRQLTLGVRYVATPNWTLTVNWRQNNGLQGAYATTWTPNSGSGAFLFQAYYRIRLSQ